MHEPRKDAHRLITVFMVDWTDLPKEVRRILINWAAEEVPNHMLELAACMPAMPSNIAKEWVQKSPDRLQAYLEALAHRISKTNKKSVRALLEHVLSDEMVKQYYPLIRNSLERVMGSIQTETHRRLVNQNGRVSRTATEQVREAAASREAEITSILKGYATLFLTTKLEVGNLQRQ